ncbi:hypothetical protein F4801DRAFT_593609 [Xylaria longipes]|nr:hypothetical protein F4801DRAFT_593609 [Xylaria longipes]
MDSNHYCLSAPTKETRLLDLLPATASGTLAARIRRFPLDDAPPYISVSHVWGNEKAMSLMHIESGCGNKDIRISRHLESLLIGLLCHTVDTLPEIWNNGSRLPMWIDMACINQTDYDSHLRYAFHYLHRVVKGIPGHEGQQDMAFFEPMGFDSVRRLLDCQWFRRRWVIQEATVPRRAIFLCGADALAMEDLFMGIDIVSPALIARPKELKTTKYATTGIFRPLLALREIKTSLRNQRRLKPLWLLGNLRLTHSTLPHDKIYGLLGLCSLEEAAGNPIRYDLEPEAYKTFIVTHTNLHQNLDFLAPSWVPNWDSRNLRRVLGLSQIAYDEKYFDTSGTLPVDYSFNANELAVSGVMVDRIQLLGESFDFYMRRPIGETPYADELSRAKAFARTVSLYGVYLSPVPSPGELPEMFYRWCQGSTLGNQLEERGLKYQVSLRDGLKGFMRMKRLPSWQPFITKRGYIGLARENCGVGDEIWIVGGCSVPVMLSPMGKGVLDREVRGEVLLDGFMFGEVTKNLNNVLAVKKVSLF